MAAPNTALRLVDEPQDEAPIALTPETFRLAVHNGCVTIDNPKTGQHRTFRVETVTREESPLHGKRIVSLLVGSNNEADYKGFGFVTDEGRVAVWKRCRGGDFEKYARLLERPAHYAAACGLQYTVEGRCRRCNRLLTVKESIDTGLGPVCAGRD